MWYVINNVTGKRVSKALDTEAQAEGLCRGLNREPGGLFGVEQDPVDNDVLAYTGHVHTLEEGQPYQVTLPQGTEAHFNQWLDSMDLAVVRFADNDADTAVYVAVVRQGSETERRFLETGGRS
jgi:hypothetical protein